MLPLGAIHPFEHILNEAVEDLAKDNEERTLANPEQFEHLGTALSTLRTSLPSSEPPLIPFLPDLSAEHLDRFVVSSATDHNRSRIFKASHTIDISPILVDICTYLSKVFCNLDAYQHFLAYRNKPAQYLVDLLQTVSVDITNTRQNSPYHKPTALGPSPTFRSV